VWDVRGAITSFTYDDAGRLLNMVHPGGGSGVTQTQTYDLEGRVRSRTSPFIADSLWYDAAGRVVRGNVTAALGQQRTPQLVYAPIGPLVYSAGLSTGAMFEEFDPDAIGNRAWQRDYGFDPSYNDRRRLLTHDGYGRLISEEELPPSPGYYDLSRTTDYDAAGNVKLTWGWERKAPGVTVYDETRSYYSADEKLSAFNRHVGQGQVSEPGGVFEGYRYDALGRRVFVRSRLTTNCNSGGAACGYAERTIWDGDQVLYEVRTPGGDASTYAYHMEEDGYTLGGSDEGHFGIVGYTHGGGIDQPLAIHHRSVPGVGSVTIIPYANWQGDYAFGTTDNGVECGLGCYQINWPGGRASADEDVAPIANPWWWGSMIGHQGDGSGLQYMRNRYYDSKTGRFTQEDPLGLAGGLNLYGFAAGDPVNFSDPFGLRPPCTGHLTSAVWGCIGRMVKPAQTIVYVYSAAVVVVATGGIAVEAMTAATPTTLALTSSGAATVPAWPKAMEGSRGLVEAVLKGKEALQELAPEIREAAARYYDRVAQVVGGKYAEAARLFNLERARYLREGGAVAPGTLPEYMKRMVNSPQ
jgi:RHS repeat-associated protein